MASQLVANFAWFTSNCDSRFRKWCVYFLSYCHPHSFNWVIFVQVSEVCKNILGKCTVIIYGFFVVTVSVAFVSVGVGESVVVVILLGVVVDSIVVLPAGVVEDGVVVLLAVVVGDRVVVEFPRFPLSTEIAIVFFS